MDILYRAKNGVVASHREYWLVHKTSDAEESSTPHSRKRAAMDLKRRRILEVKKKLYPRDDDATLGSIKDVLYAVKKTVNGQTLGYIRLFSFDVDDARKFLKAFIKLITKDGFPQDGLILDVRGNPGGNIRAAESLLQLFTPHRSRAGVVRVHQHAAELSDLQSCPACLGSETMAAIDRRIGVDGGDLFSRVSAHPRAFVQRHRSGLLRSGRAHHRRAVVQRDGHLRRRVSGQRSRIRARHERQHRSGGSQLLVAGRSAAGAEKGSQLSVQDAPEGSRDDRGDAPQHSRRCVRRLAPGGIRRLARRAPSHDQSATSWKTTWICWPGRHESSGGSRLSGCRSRR